MWSSRSLNFSRWSQDDLLQKKIKGNGLLKCMVTIIIHLVTYLSCIIHLTGSHITICISKLAEQFKG